MIQNITNALFLEMIVSNFLESAVNNLNFGFVQRTKLKARLSKFRAVH